MDEEKEVEAEKKTCLFKRMKRGGGNLGGASNRRRALQKSSSSDNSDKSDENSDTEVYKKPKKSRSGLVQSTSSGFKVNPEKKKRRWKKHLDGQNTSSDSEDEDDRKSDFGVKFQGSGAQASGSLQHAQNNATATLEIDTSHDQVMSFVELFWSKFGPLTQITNTY